MLRHCVPNESQVCVHREQSQEGCGVGLGSIIHSGRPYLDDYGEMEDDDQACSTCKDHNRTAAHYTKVSSRAIIRMIFHARRQETSLGVLVKGLCGTVRPDLGLAISNKDIQCIIHLRFVWTKIFLLIWAFPCHLHLWIVFDKNVPSL